MVFNLYLNASRPHARQISRHIAYVFPKRTVYFFSYFRYYSNQFFFIAYASRASTTKFKFDGYFHFIANPGN